MTEITRVPLQPIAKGALGKIWLGVVAAAALAGGLAWAAMPALPSVKVEREGEGPMATLDDVVFINYKGTLPDGKVFDQNQAPLPVRGVVPGFSMALQQMQKGGKYKIVIPSELAYGKDGSGPIPPNTDIAFDIDVLEVMNAQQFQMMQQMQQMQQMQGGAPHGGPAQGAGPGR